MCGAQLEVCVYDAVCENRNSLWALEPGERWHCVPKYYGGYKNMYESILGEEWPDPKDESW